MRWLMLLLFLPLLAVADDFGKASAAYQAGGYAEAAEALQASVQKEVSPGALHNLGNAEFKLGHIGPAILAWERAHALAPHFKNAAANLRYARGQMGLDEPAMAWHEQYSEWFSPDTWLWTAAITFWAGVGFLAVPVLLRRRTGWTQGVAVFAIAVFLLTLPALAGIASRSDRGVVLVADTELRLTPTTEGEVLGRLPEGDVARVEKERGEYLYVRAGYDRAGWVKAAQFAKVWP